MAVDYPPELFANPYLICDLCKKQVTHRGNNQNQPCGHGAGLESVCPSWSPVDGCQCEEHLGHIRGERIMDEENKSIVDIQREPLRYTVNCSNCGPIAHELTINEATELRGSHRNRCNNPETIQHKNIFEKEPKDSKYTSNPTGLPWNGDL